jgi:hypothetical protein
MNVLYITQSISVCQVEEFSEDVQRCKFICNRKVMRSEPEIKRQSGIGVKVGYFLF